jgi:hypothetical protein
LFSTGAILVDLLISSLLPATRLAHSARHDSLKLLRVYLVKEKENRVCTLLMKRISDTEAVGMCASSPFDRLLQVLSYETLTVRSMEQHLQIQKQCCDKSALMQTWQGVALLMKDVQRFQVPNRAEKLMGTSRHPSLMLVTHQDKGSRARKIMQMPSKHDGSSARWYVTANFSVDWYTQVSSTSTCGEPHADSLVPHNRC